MSGCPKFIMMVGLSGAGKSTFAKDYCIKNDFSYVASDEVRRRMFEENEDAHTQSKNTLVFDSCHKAIIELLKNGNNVVFDATNLISKRRVQALEKIKKAVPNVHCTAIVLIAPTNLCFKQNEDREYSVKKSVIEKQISTFQLPFVGEGWDEITLIPASEYVFLEYNDTSKIKQLMTKFDFDQRSPNHTLTLNKHCMKTEGNVVVNLSDNSWYIRGDLLDFDFSYEEMVSTARIHDFGKLLHHTKSDGIRHYYNHAERGAYKYLEYQLLPQIFYKIPNFPTLDTNDSQYKIALLINYHMLPFEWEKNEKLKQKHKKLFGNDIFTALEFLHKCNVEAK